VLRRQLLRYNSEIMPKETETVETGRCNPSTMEVITQTTRDAHCGRHDWDLSAGRSGYRANSKKSDGPLLAWQDAHRAGGAEIASFRPPMPSWLAIVARTISR
jgi:hypothetical protein